jgi:hypothetical protein
LSSLRREFVRALAAAALLVGCIDMSPRLDGKADAGSVDAGPSVDPAVETACRECVFGDEGKCAPQWADCQSKDTCRILITCSTDAGCLTLVTLEEQTQCSLGCLELLGPVPAADPGILSAVQLNLCKLNNCGDICSGR